MQSKGQYCAGNPSRIPASHQPQVYFTLPPPDRQVPENTQPSVSQAEPVGIVNDSQIRQTVGHTLTTATSLESLPTLPATAATPSFPSCWGERWGSTNALVLQSSSASPAGTGPPTVAESGDWWFSKWSPWTFSCKGCYLLQALFDGMCYILMFIT